MYRLLLDDLLSQLKIANKQLLDYLSKPPEAVKGLPQELLYFFAERGLMIHSCKRCSQQTKEETKAYELAKKIWQHFDLLEPFCIHYVNECKEKHREFDYPCEGLTESDRNNLKNFLDNLKTFGEMEFREPEGQQCFHIVRPHKDKLVRLLDGFWGEAIVLYLIRKVMTSLNQQAGRTHGFKIFSNLQLRSTAQPKTPYTELDVVLIVDKKDFYVFESKCGLTMAIDKWVDLTRLFKEPPVYVLAPNNHPTYSDLKGYFITCTPHDYINPRYFSPYKMILFSKMEEELKKMLQKNSATP